MAPQAEGGSAGRVIAGTARGRHLVAPGEGTRPLGDRVKQTLFAILEPTIRDRPFLDLYAGSGAAGIEALSRGASRAVFVEKDRSAVEAIERNLAATGFGRDVAEIAQGQVGTWLNRTAAAAPRRAPFASIVADPPYDHPEELEATLRRIDVAGAGGVLAQDGVVVAKHFWKTPPAAEIGLLRSVRERRFGETTLTFYRWVGEEDG